jgi:hypothetical protein
MNAIKIHTHLESDTIRIPELEPMVGKDVEIIVIGETPADAAKKAGIEKFIASAGKVKVDPDALDELRRDSMI